MVFGKEPSYYWQMVSGPIITLTDLAKCQIVFVWGTFRRCPLWGNINILTGNIPPAFDFASY